MGGKVKTPFRQKEKALDREPANKVEQDEAAAILQRIIEAEKANGQNNNRRTV